MPGDNLTLFTNPNSRGQIAHWMMEEISVPYETRWTQFGPDGHKSEKFLRINPMGKLPALVHNNQIVTECPAICAYAAELDTSGKLKPTTEFLAPWYRWLFFAAGPLEHAITNRALGFEVPADKVGTVGYGSFDKTISTLESYLKSHDFICGTSFTAADVYVGSHVIWGMQFEILPDLPSFISYADRLKERDAYQRAKNINNEKRNQNTANS